MADGYRVYITLDALADLEGIFEHVALQSPQNAPHVAEKILNAITGLGLFPSRHKIVGQSRKTRLPVHAMVVRPWIAYYRVDSHRRAVFIQAIRHGRQRQPRRFD
jgi:plasmid stabilization system protein ParE